MTTEKTTKKASLTVFIMRHGERLDEALYRSGRDIPPEIRVDPPLTADGHRQAREAFVQLNDALQKDEKKRRIAFAVSPTKRTIGTSLMASTSGIGRNKFLDWAFAPESAVSGDCEENAIPMIVVNGLSSCAVAIKRMGGAERAVMNGQLPCADFDANNGDIKSPISMELNEMQKRCQEIGPSLNQSPLDRVQYWKIQKGSNSLKSITPPLNSTNFGSRSTESDCSIRMAPRYCGQLGNETFLEALDRAVLLAGSENCDTLIVVAHREAIRDLADRWGANGFDVPRRLSYCCLASYKVKIYADRSCRWCFHGVVDYQNFGIENVPNKERWKRRHEAASATKFQKNELMELSD